MAMGARGYSLPEILVALVVLSTGLLGIAGTVLVSLRWTTEARARTHAAVALRDRLEALRMAAGSGAGTCDSLRTGSVLGADGLEEHWQLDSTAAGYLITATASYPSPGGRRTDTLATILGCQ